VFTLAALLLGLVGATAAGAITFAFGRGGTLTLILAGSAVSGLMAAFLALALNFAPSPYAAYEITVWMLGSLSERGWDHIALVGPFILAGLAILAFMGRAMNALAPGETQAASLGIDLERTSAAGPDRCRPGGRRGDLGDRRDRLHRPGGAASGPPLVGHELQLHAAAVRLPGRGAAAGLRHADPGNPHQFGAAAGGGHQPDRRAVLLLAGAAHPKDRAVSKLARGTALTVPAAAAILGDLTRALPGMFAAGRGQRGGQVYAAQRAGRFCSGPTPGEVALGGTPLAALPRRAGAPPRLPAAEPARRVPISVERLVALGLTPQLPAFGAGLARWMEPRLTAAIEACDLAAHRDQPATLSGGEWRARCWPAPWWATPKS
jgi:hypothetical protein